MENKNSLNINTSGRYNTPENNSQTEAFSIENAPVYFMQKDLEMLNNPKAIKQKSAPLPTSSNPIHISSSKINSFPVISPFLEKTDFIPAKPVSQKKPALASAPLIIKQPQKQETPASVKQTPLKKVFVFSIIFLSLVALGVGSYYFWLIRGEKTETLSKEPKTMPLPAPTEESASLPTAIVEPAVQPEELKETTIILDLENSTKIILKESLKSQIEKLTDVPSTIPLELKVRDSKNKPISFQIFAEKTGITFAKDVSAYIGESFRFYVLKNGSQLSLGLILESKNDTLLAKEILKKEPLLIGNLNILLLEKFKVPTKISFSDNNTYKDLSVRYFNIISPEKLTIDYAFAKNKLFFGTTRSTIYALYDLILSQSDNSL